MQGPPWWLNEARMLWHKDPFCCGRPGCQIQWSRSSGVWGHWGDRTPPLGFDLWAYLAAVWISRGVSDCLCHGWWSRFSQPSETWFLLTTLACSSKMVAQAWKIPAFDKGHRLSCEKPTLLGWHLNSLKAARGCHGCPLSQGSSVSAPLLLNHAPYTISLRSVLVRWGQSSPALSMSLRPCPKANR